MFDLVNKTVGSLETAQKPALGIHTFSTLLQDSISKHLSTAQEKRALESDLRGIANLEVRPFLSKGPIVEVLEPLQQRIMTVC